MSERALLPIMEINGAPEGGAVAAAEVNDLNDHCGVWAIWDSNNPDILGSAFIGAENIQHRGEGGAGAAAISPTAEDIQYVRGPGKVVEVFGEDGSGLRLLLPADSIAAMVHTRWPTDKGSGDRDQPCKGNLLAVGHNGQLTDDNKEYLSQKHDINEFTTDSDLLTKAVDKVAIENYGGDVERALLDVLPEFSGELFV